MSDRKDWSRRHHCAHTDFEEYAWTLHCDNLGLTKELADARAEAERHAGPAADWHAATERMDDAGVPSSPFVNRVDWLLSMWSDLSDERDALAAEVERLKSDLAEMAVDRHDVAAAEEVAAKLRAEDAQWSDQIAAALGTTGDKIGRTPSMIAEHVRREHEAHTRTFAKMVEAEQQRDALQAEVAKLRAEQNAAPLVKELRIRIKHTSAPAACIEPATLVVSRCDVLEWIDELFAPAQPEPSQESAKETL